MKPIQRLGIILCCLFFLGHSTALGIDQAKPCLSLHTPDVRLEGDIRREEFTNTDDPSKQPEIYWVLVLAKAVCVEKGDNEFLDDNLTINKIQLVLEAGEYKKYRNLVNKFVMASGTLFAAHTAHHHTALLMSIDKIEKVSK